MKSTVTISRALGQNTKCSDPFMDITVVLSFNKEWHVVASVDENGTDTPLKSDEKILAINLAKAGVDETGV